MGALSSLITPSGLVTFNQLNSWKPATAGAADTALTAKNLSTDRTNWVANGTVSAVVGQLGWNNFGANHTIFDASKSVSPSGTAVNNTNSSAPWVATHPTLMGWNGTTTYGVRVDSARQADYSNAANAAWSTAPIDASVAQNNWGASAQILNNGGTGDGGCAVLAFTCTGQYGMKLHLRADGAFGLGGGTSTAWKWYVNAAGDMVAAGNVTAYSDPRLKENFERVKDPLGILAKLDGGTFNWKQGIPHTTAKAGKRDYGVLADQVKAVMPEIVTESIEIDGQTYSTVSYEKLVPVLIEAVKQLQSRVLELEAQ
jgi:hypothetical protein